MNLPSRSGPSAISEHRHSINVCRTAQVLIMVTAAVLHFVFLINSKPLQSANDRSRWCTVWSLVERGTFQIDEIRQQPGWDTIDLVRVDGHFYSTKPPLLTTLVAGVTWCVQALTGWNLIDQLQPLTACVLLLVNLIPFIASLLIWVAILDQITQQPWSRLIGLTVAAFGTLQTPFLMTLNNHTVAAASLTLALYTLLRILRDDAICPKWIYGVCGLASAWAAVNELPAALFLAIAFLLSFWRSTRSTLLYFVPAAAVPLLALLATNVIATGSWKPTYADYGSDKYRFVVDGIPSYWMNPRGIDRNLDTPWVYFWQSMIGHHGLFSLTPMALLALVSWCGSCRIRSSSDEGSHQDGTSEDLPTPQSNLIDRNRALQVLLWVGATTTAVVIAFYMSRTQNYNYGGVSCGLRWAVWLTPLWLVGIVPVLDSSCRSRILRAVILLLLSVSIYSAWQPIENPWRHPWLYQWMESRGWIDYSEPRVKLARPLWTWFETMPQPEQGESAWIEFSAAQPGLGAKIVRLTSRPSPDSVQKGVIALEIRESGGILGTSPKIRNLLINVENFNRGDSPAEFLAWTDPKVTPAQQQADLAFVRGLPQKVPFDGRVIRYLKTPLRTEALRCIQAAAHVRFSESERAAATVHRCDTWLCNDLPFGVAQVEFRISDSNGSILFQERWTVKGCSPAVKAFDASSIAVH